MVFVLLFFIFWFRMIAISGDNTPSYELVYLNESCQDGTLCYSNNDESFYVALSSTGKPREQNGVPSFEIVRDTLLEIWLNLFSYPLLYFGGSLYLQTTSDNVTVNAEIVDPVMLDSLVQGCELPTPDAVWGLTFRLLVSASPKLLLHHRLGEKKICTIELKVPGPPTLNFSTNHPCQGPIASSLSLLFRFTYPSNTSLFTDYLKDLKNNSKVIVHQPSPMNRNCNSSVFNETSFGSRPNIVTEQAIMKKYHFFVDQVLTYVTENNPTRTIHMAESFVPFPNPKDLSQF